MIAEPLTSLTLLDRLRRQDASAWDRLHFLYAPLIEQWCRRGGLRGPDVEDVRQEVLQAVAGGLATMQRDRPGDTFRGWLRRITYFKVQDHWRGRSKQETASGGTDAFLRLLQTPATEETALDRDDPKETASLYRRALQLVRDEFEDRTWQAFYRTAVEGDSPADVAADLGMTVVAVRKAKSRILRRLKEEVGDVG